MTKEEKEKIEYLKNRYWYIDDYDVEPAVKVVLNLVDKQEEKIQSLESQLDFIGEQNKYICKLEKEFYKQKNDKRKMARAIKYLGTNFKITEDEIIKLCCEEGEAVTQDQLDKLSKEYISKDEVLKALGYEENDEEYKRIYNKDERILSLIRTINEECDRLEDIEDQKTMLEIHNIENQRDKYWEDKIRERLEKLKEKEQELSDEQGYWGSSELQAKIEELEELLGE